MEPRHSTPLLILIHLLLLFLFTPTFYSMSLPKVEKSKVSTAFLNVSLLSGSYSGTESEAIASGLGATTAVAGFVSGDTNTALGSSSASDSTLSQVATQGNCSQFSDSFAEGGTTAAASASGDCITTMDNGAQYQNSVSKSVVNMASHSTGQGPGSSSSGQQTMLQVISHGVMPTSSDFVTYGTGGLAQEAIGSQASFQNVTDETTEAHQFASAPQSASAFSGTLHSVQGGDIHAENNEILHSYGVGISSIQSTLQLLNKT